MRKITCTFLVGLSITAGTLGVAYAVSFRLDEFNAEYRTGGTRLDTCITCHLSSNPEVNGDRNPYGNDFETNGSSFDAIELIDSDGDGTNNITEINALTFPGDPTDEPGGDKGCFIDTAAFGLD